RIDILNFLVHHEVAHIIQSKRKIREPRLDLRSFQRLNHEQINHNANEVVIDKLGFDAARKIYVHTEGDEVSLDESGREAIAVNAYVSLLKIVLRNLESGTHAPSDEVIARQIAVAREMSNRGELQSLADQLYARIAPTGQDPTKTEEIDRLIRTYRFLFKETRLPLKP
ncbi:MAG TPA: hypothetical protein DF383_09155, partial [Deltaproteobacteria bacterium]|nr:hypothetical protein [Deltaproteobacteria bacterium]